MKISFSTLFLLGSFALPLAAQADIAPSISEIGSVAPPQESVIQMTRETVRFTLPAGLISSENIEKTAPTMPAEATFWLKNPTAQAVDQRVIFPVVFHIGTTGEVQQYAKHVRVWVNGKLVATKETKGSYDTYTNDGRLTKGEKVNGYEFALRIPAKKMATVIVRFDAPVGYNYYNSAEPTVTYLLASGAGWAGPIQKAEISFIYPRAARAAWVEQLESTPTTTRKTALGHVVTFTYLNLEPKQQDAPHYAFVTPTQAKKDPKHAAPSTTKYPGCDDRHPENCP